MDVRVGLERKLGVVVLEKSFESPLDCKEIKPVNPEFVNQSRKSILHIH